MNNLYLGIGSNIGRRLSHLKKAFRFIGTLHPIEIFSSVYETAPVGFLDQRCFLNSVIRTRSDLPPLVILEELKALEKKIGRLETFRNGPRVIDIDILLYGKVSIEESRLTIPHAGILKRAFVIRPLLDILSENDEFKSASPPFHQYAAGYLERQLKQLSQRVRKACSSP